MKTDNQISLQKLSTLLNRHVVAVDGDIGKAVDFLFHEELWAIPYIVVRTGNWLTGKKVLITPHVLQRQWMREDIESLPVRISKEQVRNAPLLDENAPVSRKYEQKLAQYFQWPAYWPYGPIGEAMGRQQEGGQPGKTIDEKTMEEAEGTQIRSFKEICGYTCRTGDFTVGTVEDLYTENFRIHLLFIKAGPADEQHYLVPVEKVEAIQFENKTIHLNATKGELLGSPKMDMKAPLAGFVESRIREHYSL